MPTKLTKAMRFKKLIMHTAFIFYLYTLFLFILFSIFNTYQRLLLNDFGYHHIYYGYALVQALILAKVILIGEEMKIGKRYEINPLIYPVIYKTVIFTLVVLTLTLLEHFIAGLFAGRTMAETFASITTQKINIILAKIFIMFFIYIMFFSFLELNRALGKGKLYDLFFTRRN
jgi:hypothetical protein